MKVRRLRAASSSVKPGAAKAGSIAPGVVPVALVAIGPSVRSVLRVVIVQLVRSVQIVPSVAMVSGRRGNYVTAKVVRRGGTVPLVSVRLVSVRLGRAPSVRRASVHSAVRAGSAKAAMAYGPTTAAGRTANIVTRVAAQKAAVQPLVVRKLAAVRQVAKADRSAVSAARVAAIVRHSVAATGGRIVKVARAVPNVVRPGGLSRRVRKGVAKIGHMRRAVIGRVPTESAVRVRSTARGAAIVRTLREAPIVLPLREVKGVRIRPAPSVPMASGASGSRVLRVTIAAVKVAVPVPKDSVSRVVVPRAQASVVVLRAAMLDRVVTISAERGVPVATNLASAAVAAKAAGLAAPSVRRGRRAKVASASLLAAGHSVVAMAVLVHPAATQNSRAAVS